MTFEDLNTYDGTHTIYQVCNESVPVWKEILQGISVERAAGICSGGEVSFFAVLPCVTQELVLIDHSYASMYAAIGKYHAVEKLGAEYAHKMFVSASSSSPSADLSLLFEEANHDLPTSTRCRYLRVYNLAQAWRKLSLEDVAEFKDNQEKVSFLHGDINDLIDRGPFDLVYLSNALEYNGRNGTDFQIEKIVKPGGFIAYTGDGYGHRQSDTPWEIVQETKGKLGDLGGTWRYSLGRAPE